MRGEIVMKKDGNFLIVLALLSAFLFWGTGVMAEEILVTKDGIHLGWVISKDRFMTCQKIVMEIGEGSVEKIIDRCPSFGEVPTVKGLIDGINAPNQILSIRDEAGEIQRLFYFETVEEYGKPLLKDLEKGDEIVITVPVPGRVGSIQIGRKQDSKRLF